MTEKQFMGLGLVFIVLMVCALFIAWRLQRLAKQKEDAEKRAVVAFEEMNLLTKQLRERATASGTVQPESVPPGERLQQMYPGPKRGSQGAAGS
jgi:hypothetical protein